MSEITVRYFAAAAEAAGVEEESWPASDVDTIAALRAALELKYGESMARVLRAGSFLVNGTVRRDDGPLAAAGQTSGTAVFRVDVLPPFAGG